MDTSLKRICAFLVDMLIVSFVVSLLTTYTPIDPYKDKYTATYEEYQNLAKEYKDKEINEETEEKIISLNYDLYKYRVVSSSISVVLLIGYFGIAQKLLNGQTLGKKILGLKLESKKEKLSWWQMLVRVVVLNNILISLFAIISVYLFKGKTFYNVAYVLSLLESTMYIINVMTVVFTKDNRGLHDYLARTYVVDLKTPVEPINEEPKKEITSKEEVPKKSSKTTTAKKNTSKSSTKKSSSKKVQNNKKEN